jgi:hypothetical protein
VKLASDHKKIILYANPGTEAFYGKLGFLRMNTAMAIWHDPARAIESGLLSPGPLPRAHPEDTQPSASGETAGCRQGARAGCLFLYGCRPQLNPGSPRHSHPDQGPLCGQVVLRTAGRSRSARVLGGVAGIGCRSVAEREGPTGLDVAPRHRVLFAAGQALPDLTVQGGDQVVDVGDKARPGAG